MSLLLLAGTQPTFSLEPTTPTAVSIPDIGTVTVNYRVTNNTKLTRALTVVPVKGISQNTTGPGYCGSPFTLSSKQSCLLSLELHGDELPSKVRGGPVVCKTNGPGDNTPSPYLCSQPNAANSLDVTVGELRYIAVFYISPLTNRTIAAGTSKQFFAIGIFSGGTFRNLTQQVTWSSSNISIATVSNAAGSKGLVRGVSTGTATILASLKGITGSRPLTVTSAVLTELQVEPTIPSIAAGTAQQFIATGIFSNGTYQDLTTQVNWTSAAHHGRQKAEVRSPR